MLLSAKALTWFSLLNPAVKSSWFSGSQHERHRRICSRELIRDHQWREGEGKLFPVLLSVKVDPGSSDY